jgi:hypothetical protein
MEIEVFKHEQYGPTIISSGRDKTGKVVTIQHIGLPMTSDGIVSAIRAKFDEPSYIEPPKDPDAPKDPVIDPKDIPEPVPIAKEVLDETAARVVELNKTPVDKRKFVFADAIELIKGK